MATKSSKATKQQTYLNQLLDCGLNRQAATKKAGVSLNTVRRWQREDESFREQKETLFTELEDSLLSEAYRRALAGSDVLLLALLKSVNPERYCPVARGKRIEREGLEGEDTERRLETINIVAMPRTEELETMGYVREGELTP